MAIRRTGIRGDERSGVLHPANLPRFAATWIAPDERVTDIVATYWTVTWDLPAGEPIRQRIIDFPAVTLSIEAGEVPAPLVISTVRPGAWNRTIAGRGDVFAIRLRPAGLALVSDLVASELEAEQEVTALLDARLHRLLSRIACVSTAAERAACADDTLAGLLAERPLTRRQRVANQAIDLLTKAPVSHAGQITAARLGCSARTLQRILTETVGCGPADVTRRIRLQEVTRRLSTEDATGATIAAELGYVDQGHLIREFKAVTGMTPGEYARSSGP